MTREINADCESKPCACLCVGLCACGREHLYVSVCVYARVCVYALLRALSLMGTCC